MRPLSYVLRLHFEQLRFHLKTVDYILRTAPSQDLVTYRDGPDGWTVAEIVGHLLDCERLFLERAKLTVTTENPMLPFRDQVEDVIKGQYNDCDPLTTFDQWQQTRADYLAYLATVSEADWAREGRHPKYAPFSLLDQLFLCCWHDQVHIEQITRVLTEKQR